MLLKGKTAVITGCNRGIGRATLKKFVENGSNVFACVRKESDEFSKIISDLAEEHSVKIIPLYFDMTDADAMKAAVSSIRKMRLPIDILVNNAGANSESRLFQMTPIGDMLSLFKVNFFAQMQLTQYISRYMQKKSAGSIIFLSSIAGLDGSPGQVEYVGSKAALVGVTKTLAKDLGRFNIRVNAVAPGLIDTDMGNKNDANFVKDIIDRSALKRWGTPEDVANTIVFLASDMSSYITGQCIRIDGGSTIFNVAS